MVGADPCPWYSVSPAHHRAESRVQCSAAPGQGAVHRQRPCTASRRVCWMRRPVTHARPGLVMATHMLQAQPADRGNLPSPTQIAGTVSPRHSKAPSVPPCSMLFRASSILATSKPEKTNVGAPYNRDQAHLTQAAVQVQRTRAGRGLPTQPGQHWGTRAATLASWCTGACCPSPSSPCLPAEPGMPARAVHGPCTKPHA